MKNVIILLIIAFFVSVMINVRQKMLINQKNIQIRLLAEKLDQQENLLLSRKKAKKFPINVNLNCTFSFDESCQNKLRLISNKKGQGEIIKLGLTELQMRCKYNLSITEPTFLNINFNIDEETFVILGEIIKKEEFINSNSYIYFIEITQFRSKNESKLYMLLNHLLRKNNYYEGIS